MSWGGAFVSNVQRAIGFAWKVIVLLAILLYAGILLAFALAVMTLFYVAIGAVIFDMLGWHYPVILAVTLATVGVLACTAYVFLADWVEARASRPTVEQIIESGQAELVNHDDYGKLWKIDIGAGAEPICVVEVVNMTPEADGSYLHYFLRVPPSARTAREAVAWTFGFEDARERTGHRVMTDKRRRCDDHAHRR